MELRLRPLTLADEAVAWAAHDELAADSFHFLLNLEADEPWAGYVARLERWHRGVDVPEQLVPSTFLLAEVGGEVVGRVSVRHRLNDVLLRWGGHIGYCVRPAFRGRGYAKQILRQSLALAPSLGIDRALVTCKDANTASAAVIEGAGGVLESVVPGEDGPEPWRRYWIELAATGVMR